MKLKLTYLCLALALATNAMAQSPVKDSFAYKRETTPGIPGGGRGPSSSQSPLPTSYFLYVLIKKGAPISLTGVCLQGKSYSGTLKKVASPVLLEHDATVPTGEKDTLVRATSDDVYQVELGPLRSPACTDPDEEKLAKRYEFVASFKSGESRWHAWAEKLVPLRPAAGM